jgi:hypothetical protein
MGNLPGTKIFYTTEKNKSKEEIGGVGYFFLIFPEELEREVDREEETLAEEDLVDMREEDELLKERDEEELLGDENREEEEKEEEDLILGTLDLTW